MHNALSWGLDVVRALQLAANPILDAVMIAITATGSEEFYLVLAAMLLWCVRFELGVRLIVALLLSSLVNDELKELWQQPRPFHIEPELQRVFTRGYGLPSGHSQNAVVIWGILARCRGGLGAYLAAAVVVFLVGLSRVYLGVHFPTDVFLGWGLGFVLLAGWLALAPRAERWIVALDGLPRLALVVAPPLVIALSLRTSTAAAVGGALLGLGLGCVWASRHPALSMEVPVSTKLQRMVLGLLPAGLPFALMIGASELSAEVVRAIRFGAYMSLALWLVVGAPLLFRWLESRRS